MPSVQIASSRSLSSPSGRFNAFLWAPVWEEQDQASLSVLSALARLDLDAWGEASELAQLPNDRAVERLSSLIRKLPAGSAARVDPAEVAARLIALLPRSAKAAPPPVNDSLQLKRAIAAVLIGFTISTTIMLSLNFIETTEQAANAPVTPARR